MDIFNLMYEQQKSKKEPINYTIGRLRAAIRMGKPEERLLELLNKIADDIEDLGVKYPDDVRINEGGGI